jgi:hypothetical protein
LAARAESGPAMSTSTRATTANLTPMQPLMAVYNSLGPKLNSRPIATASLALGTMKFLCSQQEAGIARLRNISVANGTLRSTTSYVVWTERTRRKSLPASAFVPHEQASIPAVSFDSGPFVYCFLKCNQHSLSCTSQGLYSAIVPTASAHHPVTDWVLDDMGHVG